MNRSERVRVQSAISKENFEKLKRMSAQNGTFMGDIINDALNLLFLPPLERPEAVVLQQITRLEKKLARLETGAAFQADLLVEFIYAWLQQRPGPHPLRSPTDDARAGSELEALMKRVADRSNPYIWGPGNG